MYIIAACYCWKLLQWCDSSVSNYGKQKHKHHQWVVTLKMHLITYMYIGLSLAFLPPLFWHVTMVLLSQMKFDVVCCWVLHCMVLILYYMHITLYIDMSLIDIILLSEKTVWAKRCLYISQEWSNGDGEGWRNSPLCVSEDVYSLHCRDTSSTFLSLSLSVLCLKHLSLFVLWDETLNTVLLFISEFISSSWMHITSLCMTFWLLGGKRVQNKTTAAHHVFLPCYWFAITMPTATFWL